MSPLGLAEFLGSSGVAKSALHAVHKLKAREELGPEEEAAVERLCSWLSRVEEESLPGPGDADTLDETQRAYLLSFRDSDSGRQYILQRQEGEGQQAPSPLVPEASGLSAADDADPGIDPALEQQLERVESWDGFDVFRVAELTEGRPLQAVAAAVLRRRRLVAKLKLPAPELASFLADVEATYHPHPYHCSLHAADVTQALGAMLAADDYATQLAPLEQLALVFSAIIHDLGHPGVNNDFLIRTNSEAALQYNDQSINEHMHLATAFRLLRKEGNNFLAGLPEEDYRTFRRLVIAIVLATDMARHKGTLQEFSDALRLWGPNLGAWAPDRRVVAMQMLMHCADISNPLRALAQSEVWGRRVHEEFFAQGDREAGLGLDVSLICNRECAPVPQSQLTFIEYVMKPSFSALAELAPNFTAMVMPNVEAAVQHWRALAAR